VDGGDNNDEYEEDAREAEKKRGATGEGVDGRLKREISGVINPLCFA